MTQAQLDVRYIYQGGTRVDLLWNNIEKHGQYTEMDRCEIHQPSGHVLLFTVHHDTSYAKQSRAKVEFLTPEGWQPLTFLLTGWADQTRESPEGGTIGLWDAYYELAARADALINTGRM